MRGKRIGRCRYPRYATRTNRRDRYNRWIPMAISSGANRAYRAEERRNSPRCACRTQLYGNETKDNFFRRGLQNAVSITTTTRRAASAGRTFRHSHLDTAFLMSTAANMYVQFRTADASRWYSTKKQTAGSTVTNGTGSLSPTACRARACRPRPQICMQFPCTVQHACSVGPCSSTQASSV